MDELVEGLQAALTWLAGGLLKVLVFLLLLTVVVNIHEFGHYLAARLVGVRVEVFSFGIGKRLFGWKRGHTDFRVSLLPLGGYVRMAGDGVEGEPTGSPEEFESRSAPERLVILAAGPVFNLLLSLVVLTAAFMLGVEEPEFINRPVQVEEVRASSPALQAGLAVGDLVTSVDGEATPTWEDFLMVATMSPGQTLEVGFTRDGKEMALPVTVATVGKNAIGWVGVEPCFKVMAGSVSAKGGALAAGMQAGDIFESVDGSPTCSSLGLVTQIQAAEGSAVKIRFSREGQERSLLVTPSWNEAMKKYVIGVGTAQAPGQSLLRRYGFLPALQASAATNWKNTVYIGQAIGGLLTGNLSIRTMSGPVEIADVTMEVAEQGFTAFLQFMAIISLNLGLLNLMPIPVLDGGRMAIIGVEAIRGRELSLNTKDWIMRVGLIMIVALMSTVIFFDFVKKFEG